MEKTRKEEQILEPRTETLVALAAATAANCIPCFEHLYEKAREVGLSHREIERVADIAGQVKNGAHLAITNTINELIGNETRFDMPCCEPSAGACSCQAVT